MIPGDLFPVIAAIAGLALAPLVDVLAARLPGEEPQWAGRMARARTFALAAAMPAAFGLLAWYWGPQGRGAVSLLYAAVFLLIAAIDLEHRLVLNAVVFPAIVAAPVAALVWGLSPPSILAGGLVEFGFFLVMALATRGAAIGGGDVKLALFLGLIAGFPGVITALFVTALASGAVSLALILLRLKSRRDYIPYAPFMLAGTAVALLWGPASQ